MLKIEKKILNQLRMIFLNLIWEVKAEQDLDVATIRFFSSATNDMYVDILTIESILYRYVSVKK